MAVTITQVSNPQAKQTEIALPPFKARIVDIAFGTGYPTGGETLTAANIGWSTIIGFIPMNGAATNATGTQGYNVTGIVNADQKSVKLVLHRTGTAVSTPLAEVANATDATGFKFRCILLGA